MSDKQWKFFRYTAIADDDLGMQGTSASAAMILTQFPEHLMHSSHVQQEILIITEPCHIIMILL